MNILRGNCLVAQSGGPTAVINSSVVGVIEEFYKNSADGKVFLGLNGIEGIMQGKLRDAGRLTENQINIMANLPSAALGSCRYKLKTFKECTKEYEIIFKVFKEYDIRYFVYVGGNDSMDAASKISEYAEEIKYDMIVIGVPKTIDNDLVVTDHSPGFGSAAKYVVNTALEQWLDINTYNDTSIMVMEVMGRDAGWIAASSLLLREAVPDINLLVYTSELPFCEEIFLKTVSQRLSENDKLLIVTSEGLKDEKQEYINVNTNCYDSDKFGHKQLGGVGSYLKEIVKKNVHNRVKFSELGITQRCAMHCISKTDLEEAKLAGKAAIKKTMESKSGIMVTIVREPIKDYTVSFGDVRLQDVCNKVKLIPKAWLDEENRIIKTELYNYISPLIKGEVSNFNENGILNFVNIRRALK